MPEVPRIELPVIVLPVHGLAEVTPSVGTLIVEVTPSCMVVVDVRLGGETVVIGLTPPPVISIEPRGTVPPDSSDPVGVPGMKSGDALPADDVVPVPVGDTTVADPEVQPPEVIAPPSKVEPIEVVVISEPVEVEELVGDMPDPAYALPVEVHGRERGLSPPGLSSVEPSGIPVPEFEAEPRVPSGDVAPSAGMLDMVCA